MNTIQLQTKISAPLERCFALSTSINLHKISASKTLEEAIDGVAERLIKLNEIVTWRAKHFGVWHKLKVQITEYQKPAFFVDEMVQGSFKSMKHKHEFKPTEYGTLMIDTFEFSSPMGVLGKVVDSLFLKNYMSKFLITRNREIKGFAETDKWKTIL